MTEKSERPQKLTLTAEPGLQDYFKEQAAVEKNTARLRELRLAKEAEEAKLSAETKAKPAQTARAPRKRVMKRGIGSA